MNEQFKELARDARLLTGWPVGEVEYQKFAELIVKECGVALSPMLRDMISRGQAYDLIKEHFGVEE
jgi:hypothetical protein